MWTSRGKMVSMLIPLREGNAVVVLAIRRARVEDIVVKEESFILELRLRLIDRS